MVSNGVSVSEYNIETGQDISLSDSKYLCCSAILKSALKADENSFKSFLLAIRRLSTPPS